MMSGTRQFCVTILMLGTLPLFAQEHGSHNSSSAATPSASRAMHGGSLSGRVRISSGAQSAGTRSNGHHHSHLQSGYGGFGYGYGWGTPIQLPYDSEYDQIEGRGTFDQMQAEQAPDNRVGPTIFEYNGRAPGAANRPIEQRVDAAEPTEAGPQAQPSETPTVLVFRDGHQQEVENYAIAGNKLIVLGEKTERIQLSDLDLNATAKANEDRGVDFKMPHQG